MGKLPQKQHAVMMALYSHYLSDEYVKTYVNTRRVSRFTTRALLRHGYITSTYVWLGFPTNMRITENGIEYCLEHGEVKALPKRRGASREKRCNFLYQRYDKLLPKGNDGDNRGNEH